MCFRGKEVWKFWLGNLTIINLNFVQMYEMLGRPGIVTLERERKMN
jgi:hypothetical protein